MNSVKKMLAGYFLWIILLVWCWYATFASEINPLRVATIAIGVTMTLGVILNLCLEAIISHVSRSRMLVVQFSILLIGNGFCAGALIMGATTLAIPSILSDYWQEITLPFILSILLSGYVGFEVFTSLKFAFQKEQFTKSVLAVDAAVPPSS